MTSAPELTITDLRVPTTADAAGSDDFRALAGYAREIRREFLLTSDRDFTDDAYRIAWTSDRHMEQVLAVGRVGGEIVGWLLASFPLQDNTHLVWGAVRVRPEFRGRGYGTALAAELRARATRPGRTTIIGSTFFTAEQVGDEGERIAPASGEGSIPAADAGVRLARGLGYTLEQVNRTSVTEPRELDLAALRAPAEAAAGEEYRLVQWHGPTPARHLDDVALLYNRMSTDAPVGGLDMTEEAWTPESIAEMEQKVASEGREQWVTAVDFAGTLVAFTVLYTDVAAPRVADQEETLVTSEHRGRRLGMLMKTANLEYLLRHRPEVQRIYTWNAAENEHMLAINAALGFRAAGGSGSWQLTLA
jgi:RimJ/RimL family protein N-acetyltransferase